VRLDAEPTPRRGIFASHPVFQVPPASGCFGDFSAERPTAASPFGRGLYLIVADLAAARARTASRRGHQGQRRWFPRRPAGCLRPAGTSPYLVWGESGVRGQGIPEHPATAAFLASFQPIRTPMAGCCRRSNRGPPPCGGSASRAHAKCAGADRPSRAQLPAASPPPPGRGKVCRLSKRGRANRARMISLQQPAICRSDR